MKQAILVVEAISTGVEYAFDILQRGYQPVVLYPYIERNGPEDENTREYEETRDECIRQLPAEAVVLRPKDNDYEKLMEELAQYSICCVLQGSEVGSALADRIAADMGLLGNDPRYSASHTNKKDMQKALADHGVRAIKGKYCRTLEEAQEFIETANLEAMVIKPVDGAGSVGVHLCSSREEGLAAFSLEMGQSDIFGKRPEGLLIQERVSGTEYIVNTVSCNGHHAVTDIWRYEKVPIGGGSEGNAYDYAVLIRRLRPEHEALARYALRVVDALGIKYGPTHGEYMLTPTGPVLIEAGSRPMGAGARRDFLEKALPHHITDIALDCYLAPEKFDEFAKQPYKPFGSLMIKLFITKKNTVLKSLPVIPILRHIRSFHAISMKGTIYTMYVKRTIDMGTSPGIVYLAAEDEEALWNDYEIFNTLEKKYPELLFEDKAASRPKACGAYEVLEVPCDGEYELLVFSVSKAGDNGTMLRFPGNVKPSFFDVDSSGGINRSFHKVVIDMTESYPYMEYLVRAVLSVVTCVEKGGELLISRRSGEAFPYGLEGLLTLLETAGLSIEMPRWDMPEFCVLRKD